MDEARKAAEKWLDGKYRKNQRIVDCLAEFIDEAIDASKCPKCEGKGEHPAGMTDFIGDGENDICTMHMEFCPDCPLGKALKENADLNELVRGFQAGDMDSFQIIHDLRAQLDTVLKENAELKVERLAITEWAVVNLTTDEYARFVTGPAVADLKARIRDMELDVENKYYLSGVEAGLAKREVEVERLTLHLNTLIKVTREAVLAIKHDSRLVRQTWRQRLSEATTIAQQALAPKKED